MQLLTLIGLAVAATVVFGPRLASALRRMVDDDIYASMPEPLTDRQLRALRSRHGIDEVRL